MSRASVSCVAERLYYDSAALEFSAVVTDVRLLATERDKESHAQLWQIALDRTAFYPDSGGQPWDTGELVATARSGAVLQVPVERVVEDEAGEVWHVVRKPLVEGTAVQGRVDAARRRDHMQQHSGQHLLSAVFLRLLGAPTVSFHLSAERVTIDLKLPAGMAELSDEQIAAVEQEANELIFDDRRLRPSWMNREQAEAMLERGELRKLPERSGPMRIVEIDGVEFNACGGTHVASTGAIGCVLLRRRERVAGGGVRVEFVCGLRAVSSSRREYAELVEAAEGLSSGVLEVATRVKVLVAENKAAAKQRAELQSRLAVLTAQDLLRKSAGGRVVELLEACDGEFLRRVASEVGRMEAIAVLGCRPEGEGAVCLALPAKDGRKAGELMRRALEVVAGRGGGGPTLAQATCAADHVPDLMARLNELLDER